MFRDMRRRRQLLSREETEAILDRNTSGVLAVSGDDGYPYAVPLSYVWADGCIWFHCAASGHKLDAIRACDKVSFCVTDCDRVVPDEYTTYFRSAIAFGRAHEVTDENEKRTYIRKLADKYRPDGPAGEREAAIDREWRALCVVKITVEHLTGKAAVELVRAGRADDK